MSHEGISDWSTSLSIPDSNGAIGRPGDDVMTIGRVSNGQYPMGMPLERTADCSTSIGIPDSKGAVGRSGDGVPPIGRISNGLHPVSVPLKGIADRSTSLSIPDSNGEVGGGGGGHLYWPRLQVHITGPRRLLSCYTRQPAGKK